MLQLKGYVLAFFASAALLFAGMVHASSSGEQKQTFGDYEIHYMGLTSSFLKPDVAAAYGIERSRSVGYLSISILHNSADAALPQPVAGSLTGTIKNLVGQTRVLEFKEVREQNSIYYIATFKVDDEDMYTLNLKATPANQSRTFDVKFSQRFYHE